MRNIHGRKREACSIYLPDGESDSETLAYTDAHTPSNFSPGIWERVARYVPVHPQTYTRLAQVNKEFYRIFMSDKLWSKLDFHNIKRNIATHYLLSCRDFTSQEKLAIAGCPRRGLCGRVFVAFRSLLGYRVGCGCPLNCDHCVAAQGHCLSPNYYVQFLVLANNYKHASDYSSRRNTGRRYGSYVSNMDEPFNAAMGAITTLLITEYGYLQYGRSAERDSILLVQRAVTLIPDSFRYASMRLQNNCDLVLLAMRFDPTLYRAAGPEVRDSPAVFENYMAYVRQTNGQPATRRENYRSLNTYELADASLIFEVGCGIFVLLAFSIVLSLLFP